MNFQRQGDPVPTTRDVEKILEIPEGRATKELRVEWVSPLSNPKDHTLSFLNSWNDMSHRQVASHPRTLFLAPFDPTADSTGAENCILVENPRYAYALVASTLFDKRKSPGISRTALVEDGVTIGESASIGHNVVIEKGARIGARVCIGHNTVIHGSVELGDDVTIGSNSAIGTIGFGLERDVSGIPFRIPHLGGVTIGNNVEIGSCCTIARGTIDDTILESHVKVDDDVFVAHNARVREGAFLTTGTITCGSADIGRRAWIAPGSIVINKATVGDDVMLGLGAVVVDDVPSESLSVGVPARVRGRNPMLPLNGYPD